VQGAVLVGERLGFNHQGTKSLCKFVNGFLAMMREEDFGFGAGGSARTVSISWCLGG
jgi:hypothetical protein